MPTANHFRHQSYDARPAHDSWRLLRAHRMHPTKDPAFDDRVTDAGQKYREAGVKVIYLVHGTFAGDDALGFFRSLSRVFPEAAFSLRQVYKGAFDKLVKDVGNYAIGYAERFEQLAKIPVRLFRWSSENHHLARAEAAVRLIGEVSRLELAAGDRVLLWGHSHAGNVFALMSNLLAADAWHRDRFFHACRSYTGGANSSRPQWSLWNRVHQWLATTEPRSRPILDIVTFGTPIRYGWDANGYGHLLHITQHHPREGYPEYQAAMPQSMEEAMSAADGDYIQHLGVAGTNLTPNLFDWRTWLADSRLNRLLQKRIRRRDLLKRLKVGKRVPDDGDTLLVDYGPAGGNVAEHLLGHAVYTRLHWLPFHAEAVATRFYSSGGDEGADLTAAS